jgi:hypothetical protein
MKKGPGFERRRHMNHVQVDRRRSDEDRAERLSEGVRASRPSSDRAADQGPRKKIPKKT